MVSVERMRNYCQNPIRVPVTYVLHSRVRKVANESTANGIYRKVIINKRAAASRFMIRTTPGFSLLVLCESTGENLDPLEIPLLRRDNLILDNRYSVLHMHILCDCKLNDTY